MKEIPGPRFTKHLFGLAVGIASLTAITGISGCHNAPDAIVSASDSGPDPSDANMAPVAAGQQQQSFAAVPAQSAPARALPARQQNESQQRAEEYAQTGTQAGAPTDPQQSPSVSSDQGDQYDPAYEADVDAGQQALEASDPPPPLPTYQQPEAPAPNYLWTPGYWMYAPVGYYWVPGAWVAAPYPGALWTPGYWGYYGGRYRFNRGFWGSHIGFYGGVNYGFGYIGSGYHGGYWRGNNFYYNRTVNRINVTRITNVYNHTVVVNNYNRISYNGGRGGIAVRPQPAELAAMRGPRVPPMTAQIQNQRQAAQNRAQFFNQNRGRPAIVAAPRPFVADKGVRPTVRPMPVNQPQPRPTQPQIARARRTANANPKSAPDKTCPSAPDQAHPATSAEVRA